MLPHQNMCENQAKSRSDEESINFRPSPNFKHMKKYLKSKFEEASQQQIMANANAPQGAPDSSSNGNDEREKVNKTVVQPPLPPNSPPPDTPPIINLKKEIEDDEYQCNTENSSDFIPPEDLMTETIKTDKSEASEKPEVTMCRNFVRGTCKKGASCIFAHEIILSQLPGVYTFCRNFQNSRCTHPKCKFVHATVFEKEYFFRTAYLPPHALMHLKEGNAVQPPPPPEETPRELPQAYDSAQPPASVPCVKPVPIVNLAPAATGERAVPFIFTAGQSPITSPKSVSEWSAIDTSSSSPSDLESCEPLAKQCKDCDSTAFRVAYNKLKLKKMYEKAAAVRRNIALINKKQARLTYVLESLFKPNGTNGVGNGFSTSPVAEVVRNRSEIQSSLAADNSAVVSNHYKAFLAQLLLNSKPPSDHK